MSKDTAKQASTLHDEIASYFDRVKNAGFQPRLRTVRGVCQFDIKGAGTWHGTIKDGVVTIAEGAAHSPAANCVLSTTAEDFVRILRGDGHMNLMTAVLQEIVTIKGDAVFAYTVLGSFVMSPSGAGAR